MMPPHKTCSNQIGSLFCREKIRTSTRRLLREVRLSKVVRFVAGFPFDVAADAGLLRGGGRFAAEYGIEGGAEVLAGHGLAVSGAAVVELPAVNEAMVLVEKV